jgi:hypothetical protein
MEKSRGGRVSGEGGTGYATWVDGKFLGEHLLILLTLVRRKQRQSKVLPRLGSTFRNQIGRGRGTRRRRLVLNGLNVHDLLSFAPF